MFKDKTIQMNQFKVSKMAQFDTSKWSALIPPPGKVHKKLQSTIHADNKNSSRLCSCMSVRVLHVRLLMASSEKSQMFDQKPEEKAVHLRDSEGAL